MISRQRRPQCGEHVLTPRLVGRDHVRVALDHHCDARTANGFACLGQTVQRLALDEDRRLGAIEVLRFLVAERPGAEAHHFALKVRDGEHQTAAKTVVRTSGLPSHQEPSGSQILLAETLPRCVTEPVPVGRREPESEGLHTGGSDSPSRHVIARCGCLRRLGEHLSEEPGGEPIHPAQLLANRGLPGLLPPTSIPQAVALCHTPGSFMERNPEDPLHELYRIARRLAPVAVEHPLARYDVERRLRLRVEWARGLEILARLLQGDVLGDHIDDVGGLDDLRRGRRSLGGMSHGLSIPCAQRPRRREPRPTTARAAGARGLGSVFPPGARRPPALSCRVVSEKTRGPRESPGLVEHSQRSGCRLAGIGIPDVNPCDLHIVQGERHIALLEAADLVVPENGVATEVVGGASKLHGGGLTEVGQDR